MDQKHLKIATLLALGGLIAFLGYRTFQSVSVPGPVAQEPSTRDTDPDAAAKRAALEQTTLGTFGASTVTSETNGELDDSSNELPADQTLTLRVGAIGATPMRDQVTLLSEFPYQRNQVRLAYARSRDRACRLLVSGVPVSAPLQPPTDGRIGTLGRKTVLTIGLEYDTTGPKKLPAVTRGQINKYFAKHRLAIQPVLYHDSQNRPYFGTDCQAAFYELQRPGLTVKAEPMIEASVSRFRALGIVGDAESGAADDILGRTLALAFTFVQKDETLTGAADKTKATLELLLLHLTPTCTADEPEIQVYVTSDERMNLHRLETRGLTLNAISPTISSDIQFNKAILMGMYPADPVVSGIRYRSAGILAMDTIKRLSGRDGNRRGGDAANTALSLTEILDQFGKLAGTQ